MGNDQSTFIQLPLDITNPIELRRFLDKVVQQLDVAFGNRGSGAFSTDTSVAEIVTILQDHEERITNLTADVNQLNSDVASLKAGELIVTTLVDIIIPATTETILCDCSNNKIVATLPDPSVVFNTSRSKMISIGKIDKTSKKVDIVPFGSESILGSNKVILRRNNDIVNLITNGTDWYLGA